MVKKKRDPDDLRHGEGFVEKRPRADGSIRYVARWYEMAANNKERLRARTFASPAQATAHLIEIGHRKRTGQFKPDSELTIEDVIEEYMAGPARKWKDNTRVTYQVYHDRLIYPWLRTVRIADLTARRVQLWVDALARDGKSASAISNAQSLLSGALKEATRLEVIPRNVAQGTKLPERPKSDYVTWSVEEIRAVLLAVREDPFRFAIYAVLVATGLRPGELRALMWECVDLTHGILLIRRTITRNREGHEVIGTTTKTGRSRKIVIPREAADALSRWRMVQVERRLAHPGWIDQDIVFDRGDGQFLSNATLQLTHDRMIIEAGVRDIRLHDIRHTYATLAFAENTNPKIVSEVMGHGSVAFTLDRYTHMTTDDQQRSADSISARFFEAESARESRES